MYRLLHSILLASAFVIPTQCYPEPLEKLSGRVDGPMVLHPINIRAYESVTGLRRRGQDEFSDLDPKTQSQLIYGTPGGLYHPLVSPFR